MKKVNIRDLLEAGAHFGHKTKYWNPKMKDFIYGDRNGIHIINLEKTIPQIETASDFVKNLAAQSGTILFVGTKKSVKDAIKKESARPFKIPKGIKMLVVNSITGERASYSDESIIIEAFKEKRAAKKAKSEA